MNGRTEGKVGISISMMVVVRSPAMSTGNEPAGRSRATSGQLLDVTCAGAERIKDNLGRHVSVCASLCGQECLASGSN